MKVLEFYDRALKGERVEEQEFDMHILPGKLRELIKKYEIAYNPEEPVPQDLDMAKRVFDAGLELITGIGLYCCDTRSIIEVEEEEVRSALAEAPQKHVIGEDAEAVETYCRGLEDKRRPIIIGGPGGAPLSEENFIDIMTSYAQEPVDGLTTGALQTIFGKAVRANEPVELMACHYEALWSREAVRRAGKPGLSLLGTMSGVSSEVQNAGDFPGGMRPSDMHLICFSNELKVNWEDFKKIIHSQNMGNIINACSMPMLGGYCGSPEGTAITTVAEVMQGFLLARPTSYDMAASNIRFGVSDRTAIWANCIAQMAFIKAGANVTLVPFLVATAGPCTEMICDEVAAMSIALTASGYSTLYGALGCEGAKMDYVTGMESRMIFEMGVAAAGVKIDKANEMVKQIIGKYEETLRSKKAPEGQHFRECYGPGLLPSPEYIKLWSKKKKEYERMGLVFHQEV